MDTDSHVYKLPDEILLKIFSLFTPVGLSKFVSPVCRRWRQLSYDPSLWTDIVLHDLNIKQLGSLKLMLEHSPLLRRLKCHRVGCLSEVIEHTGKFCKDLEELTIITPQGYQRGKLSLEESSENQPMFRSLRVLNINTSLQCDASYIVSLIRRSPNLLKLHVKTELSSSDWENAVEVNHTMLQCLSFACLPVSERSTSLRFLQSCTSLNTLQIQRCEVDQSLLDILASLEDLRHVKFGQPELVSEAVHFSKNMLKLELLAIENCHSIGDNFVRSVALNCPNLKYLALRNCKNLTDVSLAIALHKLQKLQVLELFFAKKVEGWCFNCIQENTQLKYIDVSYCTGIQDLSELKDLVRRAENLVVFAADGMQLLPEIKKSSNPYLRDSVYSVCQDIVSSQFKS